MLRLANAAIRGPAPAALADLIRRTERQDGITGAPAGWPGSSATTLRQPSAVRDGSGTSSARYPPRPPLGGYGYINEYETARLWRDTRVQRR